MKAGREGSGFVCCFHGDDAAKPWRVAVKGQVGKGRGVALTVAGAPHHLCGMTTDDPQMQEPIDDFQDEGLEETLPAGEVDDAGEAEPVPETPKRAGGSTNTIRNLWIVIGGLAVLLVASMLSSIVPKRTAVIADEPELAALRADLEMRRAELNRQRAELNLPPLPGRGEDLETITERLRKDAETLVSLIERSRSLITEKDRLLAEKNMELIRSEQAREVLQSQLAERQAGASGTAELQSDLSDALARANRLADELADARKLIEELSEDTASSELDTLSRRLEEVTRARDFFELRVQQLEASRRDGHDANGGELEEEVLEELE